jgi:hypothetical protein
MGSLSILEGNRTRTHNLKGAGRNACYQNDPQSASSEELSVFFGIFNIINMRPLFGMPMLSILQMGL